MLKSKLNDLPQNAVDRTSVITNTIRKLANV